MQNKPSEPKIVDSLEEKQESFLKLARGHERRLAAMEEKLDLCYNELKELNYAHLLHDGMKESPWLKNQAFDLHNWAANYSFIYLLFRILDKIEPRNILEFGLGQTTKLTTQYIAHKNPGACLNVCEHSLDWIQIYQQELPKHEHIRINHLDLEYFEYRHRRNDKYAGLLELVGDQKFDLIIVDGPVGGGKNLPRSNVVDLICHGNLSDDFVIIFDDAERVGEKNTIRRTQAALRKKSIAFQTFERFGIKRQAYIVSMSRSFAGYL